MPRYSADTKEKALQMISEVGVQRTHEEMGIAVQTLYHWKRAAQQVSDASADTEKAPEQEKVLVLLAEQADLAAQLESAQKEIARLTQELADANAKRATEAAAYNKKLRQMRKLINTLLDDK